MTAHGFYSFDEGFMTHRSTATEFCVLYEAPYHHLKSPPNLTRSWLFFYLGAGT